MIKRIKNKVIQTIKKKLIVFNNRGSNYTCPFCNYSAKHLSLIGIDQPILKEYQVIGGGKRKGGCFNCGSSDRERLIYAYLNEELNFFNGPKNKKILHIAPEKYIAPTFLKLNFDEYVCGDLFTQGYSYPEYVQNMDVLNLPFKDDKFDLILCNHVLEHIVTDDIAIKELNRVLKPGGVAILQVPLSKNSEITLEDKSITDPQSRLEKYGQFDHVRIYGQDYSQILEKGGFHVNRVNISKECKHYGINEDEDIFACTK
jgi:SAM-dependent methyltransferase